MSEAEILRQFKEEGVSLTELERRSGFSRKKITRICQGVMKLKTGPKKVEEYKVKGEGALDILLAPVGSVFGFGGLQ